MSSQSVGAAGPPLRGIVCPVATPIVDGELNEKALLQHIAWLAARCDGLFLLGSSGELATLGSGLRSRVGRLAAEVPNDVVLCIGVGEASTSRVLEQMEAVPVRAQYIVVPGPYYFAATSQQALIEHFTVIADRAPRPVVLYNLPQNTGVAIAPDTVRQLATHPNIVAIKDSGGDMFAFSEFVRLVPEGFAVLQGREQLAAVSLWLGADGVISALANFAPELLGRLVDEVANGRRSEALELQKAITDLARVFDQGHWVSALKAALQELGLPAGPPLAPLQPCSGSQRDEIRRLLRGHHVPSIVS